MGVLRGAFFILESVHGHSRMLAGGLIKGVGDGMRPGIQHEREIALELPHENRRARERQEDRAFAVEERDYDVSRIR